MRVPAFVTRCPIATVWTIFLVVAFHAFLANVTNLSWSPSSDLYPWLAVILVVSSVYLVALFRAKKDSRIHLIALLFIGLTLVCRILWVHYFDAQQISDFRSYWNIGHSIVVDGVAAQSSQGVYFLRSIFYTAPIQYIFGNSQQALELVNVFLVTVTMFIFYDFGRRAFSARIAAGALLFFFWSPDIWYGVTLASHDIAYLPWLAGLCWIMYWVDRKLYDKPGISIPLVLLSIGGGLLIFLLAVQRGYGRPAWVALLILLAYYLYDNYREYRANPVNESQGTPVPGRARLKEGLVLVLVLLIIPLGTYQLSKSVFIRSTDIWSDSDLLTYISAKEVYGSDRWREMLAWRKEYAPLLPDDVRTEFSVRKLLSEVSSDPVETIRHVFRKNAVLANPTGTLSFSTRPAEDSWVRRTNTDTVPMQRALHKVLAAILFFLLFLRLLLYPLFPLKRGSLFLVLFTVSFYAAILLFTEAQPRYSQFTVFLTSLFVAQLLFETGTLRGITWWDSIKRLPSRAVWRKR